MRIGEDRVESYRNFANKLWNASRLVLANLDGYDPRRGKAGRTSVADRWILSRLAATVAAVRRALDGYRFNDAAAALYQFVWDELCDWYLEIAKRSLYQTEDPAARAVTQHTLVDALETTLRLLHPFMPFITEELWQRLPHRGASIMIAPYPKAARRGATPTPSGRCSRCSTSSAPSARSVARAASRPAVEVTVTRTPRRPRRRRASIEERSPPRSARWRVRGSPRGGRRRRGRRTRRARGGRRRRGLRAPRGRASTSRPSARG